LQQVVESAGANPLAWRRLRGRLFERGELVGALGIFRITDIEQQIGEKGGQGGVIMGVDESRQSP
jgi:hypothetical protein